MSAALLEVVLRKVEAGEAPAAILRAVPPAERQAVADWAGLEIALLVLELPARGGAPGWPQVIEGSARRLARLLIALRIDPATPHPPEGDRP